VPTTKKRGFGLAEALLSIADEDNLDVEASCTAADGPRLQAPQLSQRVAFFLLDLWRVSLFKRRVKRDASQRPYFQEPIMPTGFDVPCAAGRTARVWLQRKGKTLTPGQALACPRRMKPTSCRSLH
jgi:hypothetical protein